jgi:hypothetical protein
MILRFMVTSKLLNAPVAKNIGEGKEREAMKPDSE